jgi:hypothetical protein
MGVVSAANTNQAFIDANGDDSTIGRLDLDNTLPESGSSVQNIQRAHNAISSYSGMPLNSAKDVVPTWVNGDVGTSSDTLRAKSDALTAKFNSSSGHQHTGGSGDAPRIQGSYIASVPLRGSMINGTNIVGITGTSTDVSSLLLGKIPSASSVVKGVVTNAPYNKIILRELDGTEVIDSLGNEVYGRLTFSASVWTLSYFSFVSGLETAYSFAVSTDLLWWYQELFNPIVDSPVYSDFVFTPSTDLTNDIVDASETQAGKVYLSNTAPADPSGTAAKGVSTRAAKADHVHQAVHSLFITGDTHVYGDVELEPGPNATLTRTGNKITIDSVGAVGYQEVPSGPINGVNTTFGPLTLTPSDGNSVIVFVDGIQVDLSKYSIAGLYIIFGSGNQPITGQSIYAFYLTAGVAALPPVPTGAPRTEFRTITAPEQSAKVIVLAHTPADPVGVLVDIIGGTAQEFNVDYTIVSNEFRWNGYSLDGLLSAGDRIRFHYFT